MADCRFTAATRLYLVVGSQCFADLINCMMAYQEQEFRNLIANIFE